jgi:hypothetical protein
MVYIKNNINCQLYDDFSKKIQSSFYALSIAKMNKLANQQSDA